MGIFSGIKDFFFGSDDPAKQVVTSSEQPWGPQAKGLETGFNRAGQVLNNSYSGAYKPSFGTRSQTGMNSMFSRASAGNPFTQTGTNTLNDIGYGGARITTGGKFGTIGDRAAGPGSLSRGMFNDVASGNMVNSNPHREGAIKYAMDDTHARLKADYGSAGRLGSSFAGKGMAEGLGRVGTEARMAGYDADMDRMMNGATARSQEDLARMGVGLSAAEGETNVQSANLDNQLTAVGMFPAFNDMRYADDERMISVGGAEDEMADRQRNYDWDMLNKYQSMFGGNFGQTTMEPPPSTASRLVGGIKAVGDAVTSFFPGGR